MKFINKDINLFLLTTISIIVLLIISPIVNGAYGTNFSNAVEISAGITNDQFQDGDNVGYYKISCTSSTMMDIRFNCTYSYHITLIVYDPNQIQVANNTYYGSGFYARILLTCSKSGYYFIKVNRSTTSGTLNFTINIILSENTFNIKVPGFEYSFIILGLAAITLSIIIKRFSISKKFLKCP